MNKQPLAFWKSEREMQDRFYRDRMHEWGGDQGQPNRLNARSTELEVAYKQAAGRPVACIMRSRRKWKPRRPRWLRMAKRPSWNWPRCRTEHPNYTHNNLALYGPCLVDNWFEPEFLPVLLVPIQFPFRVDVLR